MPTRSVLDRRSAGAVLPMDGGTDTEIQRRGVNVGKSTSVTGCSSTPHWHGEFLGLWKGDKQAIDHHGE